MTETLLMLSAGINILLAIHAGRLIARVLQYESDLASARLEAKEFRA